jgi:catechol 2,3-dioxygenase-like lactoylglutathione lyase family enzyme
LNPRPFPTLYNGKAPGRFTLKSSPATSPQVEKESLAVAGFSGDTERTWKRAVARSLLNKSTGEKTMRQAMLFAAGLLSGLAVYSGVAQNAASSVVMMNHVGINVPNIPEAVTYYTEKMGYREAFRVHDANGQPRIVYLHISRNTFLELNQANAQRPAGFTHYGLHVENVAEAAARFRRNGVTVSDTNTSDTKAILANITDPYMGRIELAELTPDSLHYKAIQSWK